MPAPAQSRFSRGSEWRRWDLHFHTPASYDYQAKGLTSQEIVSALLKEGVEVVAVTDHHLMDVVRIREMQALGAGRLTVLPGIELRSELGGRESIHYIGIFPEDAPIERLWPDLRTYLGLHPDDVATKGDDNIYCPFEASAALIRQNGGLVSIHAGTKSNSIESIRNVTGYKMTLKKDLVKENIDIMEVADPDDAADYRTIVFPEIGRGRPLIICSDNHDCRKYATRTKLWIKADPTFRGLEQAAKHPDERIFLGDEPPARRRLKTTPGKFVGTVHFSQAASVPANPAWFSGSVEFGPELVAVIGNKGSGKSALADVLALLGNSPLNREEHFSFLNSRKFLHPAAKLGRVYQGTLVWADASSQPRLLGEGVPAEAPERIRYIPQEYFEKVCNELRADATSQFQAELKRAIFSRIDEADRMGGTSLDEVIDIHVGPLQEKLGQLRESLAETNREIVALHQRLDPATKAGLVEKQKLLTEQLTKLDAAKPPVVAPPNATSPEAQQTVQNLTAAQQALAAVQQERAQATTKQAEQSGLAQRLANARQRLRNFETDHATMVARLTPDLAGSGLTPADLVSVKFEWARLDTAIKTAETARDAETTKLNAQGPGSLAQRLKDATEALAKLQQKLDQPTKDHQVYVARVTAWQKQRDTLTGKADEVGTIAHISAALAALAALPTALTELRQRRNNLSAEIHATLLAIREAYARLHRAVQEFVTAAGTGVDLRFTTELRVNNFPENFFNIVSRGAAGTFYGVDEGASRLRSILNETDFNTGALAFPARLLQALANDERQSPPPKARPMDQLRKGATMEQLLDYLFGFSYLEPRYELSLGQTPLEQLSPGERGLVLLIFYLMVDREDIPLVIDQPEHNLDNQTVATKLVPFVRAAKAHRQIIIVTHNPNLAVVCDAEQVIVAHMDKSAGNSIRYESGSLEDPVINRSVLDILEGTQPAFETREETYFFERKGP
jgi:predicted metal-dependent phosphoesterase TrpH/predicted ATPase